MKSKVRDRRSSPFIMVEKPALRALRDAMADEKISGALVRSVYFALVEIANDNRGDEVEVSRKELGERAMVSARTVTTAIEILERGGLVHEENDNGKASTWTLTDPPDHCTTCSGPESEPLHQVQRSPAPDAAVSRAPVRDPISSDKREEEKEQRASAPSDIDFVFDHWRTTFDHLRSVLDGPRRHVIQKALGLGFDASQLCRSMDGHFADDWWQKRGKHAGSDYAPFDEIKRLLADAATIERGLELPVRESTPTTVRENAKDRTLRRYAVEHGKNVREAQRWPNDATLADRAAASMAWLTENGFTVAIDGDEVKIERTGE